MYIKERTLTFVRAFLKSYGPSKIKKVLWDEEFSSNKWDFADHTIGDCVYPHLEKHLKHGTILDLGCGSGNTANELTESSYQTYIGVDISQVALDKAARRTQQTQRAGKNQFVRGDFINYVPAQKFDVILFRESMYHVPLNKIKVVLDRYSEYLREGGVFVVRMYTFDKERKRKRKQRPKAMFELIEAEFDVVEKCHYGEVGAMVMVFRPRHRG